MIGIDSKRADLRNYSNKYLEIGKNTIKKLMNIIGDKVEKIEHVGSTAIIGIKSKPIIDIVIGVKSLDIVDELKETLEENEYYYSKTKLNNTAILFICEENGKRTHNIYFVIYEGDRWKEFVYFRDALNADKELAKEYENLKINLSYKYSDDIQKYTEGKANFISSVIEEYRRRI